MKFFQNIFIFKSCLLLIIICILFRDFFHYHLVFFLDCFFILGYYAHFFICNFLFHDAHFSICDHHCKIIFELDFIDDFGLFNKSLDTILTVADYFLAYIQVYFNFQSLACSIYFDFLQLLWVFLI